MFTDWQEGEAMTKKAILKHLTHDQTAQLLAEIADELGVEPPGEHTTANFIAKLPQVTRLAKMRADAAVVLASAQIGLQRVA